MPPNGMPALSWMVDSQVPRSLKRALGANARKWELKGDTPENPAGQPGRIPEKTYCTVSDTEVDLLKLPVVSVPVIVSV